MKNFKLNTSFLSMGFLALVISFTACKKDKEDTPPLDNSAGYSNGIFIINEGAFQTGTGTITYLSRDGSETIDKLYQQANNLIPIGNVAQSMNVYPIGGEDAFISVNNANKVEVVSLKSFQQIQTLENMNTPRYIEFSRTYGKMYISSWDNTVKIFNLDGTESLGQVNVGTGPEKMLEVNDQIWVLNQGGFSVDSTISVIDTETNQLVETIQVYAKPTGIQLDDNGNVWILCSGNGWNGFPGPDDTEAHLICINPNNYNLLKDISFPNSSEHPEKLVINDTKDLLYYNFIDGIYRFDIHDFELAEEAFIPRPYMFYGLGLDSFSNTLYASDPLDYVQNGWIYRYDAFTGAAVDSLEAGIIPGEFFFSPPVVIE